MNDAAISSLPAVSPSLRALCVLCGKKSPMRNIVIDTCCLINLCAAGELSEWLPSLGHRWHLPRAVRDEALYLHFTDEDGARKKEPVDLKGYLREGILHECALDTAEESQLFVELAADLDDGESMALAIASSRGWALATDDRKARRTASGLDVSLLTTPQIMKKWEATGNPTPAQLGAALGRIQAHARYRPPRDSDQFEWWEQRRNEASANS